MQEYQWQKSLTLVKASEKTKNQKRAAAKIKGNPNWKETEVLVHGLDSLTLFPLLAPLSDLLAGNPLGLGNVLCLVACQSLFR